MLAQAVLPFRTDCCWVFDWGWRGNVSLCFNRCCLSNVSSLPSRLSTCVDFVVSESRTCFAGAQQNDSHALSHPAQFVARRGENENENNEERLSR